MDTILYQERNRTELKIKLTEHVNRDLMTNEYNGRGEEEERKKKHGSIHYFAISFEFRDLLFLISIILQFSKPKLLV